MPFRFDAHDNSIRMACGDTADISINISWSRLSQRDVILFAVFDKNDGKDLVCKSAEIIDGMAYIRLCNHDTRDIPEGRYKWNLRIVTDPEYDENGNVCVEDCSDNVITVFSNPPTFSLSKGGGYV